MSTFMISCGGTGGHLAPGVALAQALMRRGHQCLLITSYKEVDARLVKKYRTLDVIPVPGVAFSWNPFLFVKFIFGVFQSVILSFGLLRKYRPDVVIGFGGFMTVGLTIASFCKRCPVVLHEANRHPGRTIRCLSGVAKRVYLPQGVKLRGIPPHAIRFLGFPLRREIQKLSQGEARENLGIEIHGKLLVVLGGSQGARSLNEWVNDNAS